MRKIFPILFLMLFLSGCGSDGTASDNPPDVAGSYSCLSDCVGSCTYDDELTVVQSGDDVIITSDSFGGASGSINNDGEFSVSSDTCDCDGQFVSGTAIADCTCSGVDCQSVTYDQD